jgi:hypothetical protein
MAYTSFSTPTMPANHSVLDWIKWLRDNDIVHDFLPAPPQTCDLCGKPCNVQDDGTKWPLCFICPSYTPYLDGLIVASYSLYSGLESLVGTYKDDRDARGRPVTWKRLPLGAILWATLRKHGSCIDRALGPNPIYTWVPSNETARPFDHLHEIICSVSGQWEAHPWQEGVVVRNREILRPSRNSVSSVAYDVTMDVSGRGVLLFDDLWTTGASMASSAAALKHAGASTVIGLVLGRQVNPALTGHAELADVVSRRGWNFDACSLCP